MMLGQLHPNSFASQRNTTLRASWSLNEAMKTCLRTQRGGGKKQLDQSHGSGSNDAWPSPPELICTERNTTLRALWSLNAAMKTCLTTQRSGGKKQLDQSHGSCSNDARPSPPEPICTERNTTLRASWSLNAAMKPCFTTQRSGGKKNNSTRVMDLASYFNAWVLTYQNTHERLTFPLPGNPRAARCSEIAR